MLQALRYINGHVGADLCVCPSWDLVFAHPGVVVCPNPILKTNFSRCCGPRVMQVAVLGRSGVSALPGIWCLPESD